MVYQTGIVLFILIVFHGLIGQVSDDVHFRVEQSVSQRMAMQDGMTDFRSAQALEKKLAALHQRAQGAFQRRPRLCPPAGFEGHQRPARHEGGDEAVVAAAQCISGAFPDHAAWETSFYRVSGDEFAVVQVNPILPLETLEAKLHESALRLNRRDRGTSGALRLVCGYSFLRAPTDRRRPSATGRKAQTPCCKIACLLKKIGGGG